MHRPYTIGITGGSGSGKTHFLKLLASHFREDEICLISQDHYYKPINLQTKDDKGIENFDLPSAIDRKKFHDDIIKLKSGEIVLKEEYTFNKPDAKPQVFTFKPSPILIVEGLFVQYFGEIAEELDLKVFIEAKDHLKISRRIRRDNQERGYDLDDVLYRFQHHVMPVYETLIKPLKDEADFIIPNNQHFGQALNIITWALKKWLSDHEKPV
jgi:uridine kinase